MPRSTNEMHKSEDEDDEDDDVIFSAVEKSGQEAISGDAEKSASLAAMAVKTLYVMSTWRHPRKHNGRLNVLVLLPTGILDRDDGIRAVVIDAERPV